MLIKFDDIAPSTITDQDYVVFGGTFDPIHLGHISVIKTLLKVFRSVLLATTESNPWKKISPAPLKLRKKMIELVLDAENIPFHHGSPNIQNSSGVTILDIKYNYSEEVVNYCRSTFPGTLYWAVGEDGKDEVAKWRNWEKLGVTTVVCPITIEIHSTALRNREFPVHSAIKKFVVEHKLYNYF